MMAEPHAPLRSPTPRADGATPVRASLMITCLGDALFPRVGVAAVEVFDQAWRRRRVSRRPDLLRAAGLQRRPRRRGAQRRARLSAGFRRQRVRRLHLGLVRGHGARRVPAALCRPPRAGCRRRAGGAHLRVLRVPRRRARGRGAARREARHRDPASLLPHAPPAGRRRAARTPAGHGRGPRVPAARPPRAVLRLRWHLRRQDGAHLDGHGRREGRRACSRPAPTCWWGST